MNKEHLAPFPLELPSRCIKMFSWVDSIIYDPYGGSATTAIACKLLNRKFIISEISKNYCEIGEKRLSLIHKKFI